MPKHLPVLASFLLLAGGLAASARDFRVNQLPNGSVFRCATCHFSASGGGARNAFGLAVQAITGSANRAFWSPTLAALDSDGDGFANGVELRDPEGDGTATAGTVFNPGSAASRPPPANVPPTVAITLPANGAVFTAPAVTDVVVEAADSDGTVARVEFLNGTTLLGVRTNPPFVLRVDWPLGGHVLTARAVDDDGATNTSDTVTITVNAPDAPALATIARGGNGVALTWTGGGGPFAVQTRPSLDDPWCTLLPVTAARALPTESQRDAAFYRVADLAESGPVTLTAFLAGAAERPTPVVTAATGTAALTLTRNTLTFTMEYAGLGGPAIMAHIHGAATAAETGGIIIDLEPFNGGAFGTSGTLAGSVVLTPEQKAVLLSGLSYVNIHTDANQGGEIRGQITPAAFQARLDGASERPAPVSTPARGSGAFQLVTNRLDFTIEYADLKGPAVMAHLHGPAGPEQTASILVDLAPFHAGPLASAGVFTGSVTLDAAQLAALVDGLIYVNIHTAGHPGGEIRGQVLADPVGPPAGAP